MGLILDSTVLIHAERKGLNARHALTQIMNGLGSSEVGISVVTALEFAHGIARADTEERRAKRQGFLDELLSALPIYPITLAIALKAGQIDGTNSAPGASRCSRRLADRCLPRWKPGLVWLRRTCVTLE